MGWKEKASKAIMSAEVAKNVITGSPDTSQLADYHQAQNEQRMAQYRESVQRSSQEQARGTEDRRR